MKRTPITLRGAEALRIELRTLKSEARPNVIKAIAEARAHGDLSENAEYHAAREQQGFIEGRINEIESRLAAAEVIDVAQIAPSDRVIFGATVDLEDQDDRSGRQDAVDEEFHGLAPSFSVVYWPARIAGHSSTRPLGHSTRTLRALSTEVPSPTNTLGSLAEA